MESIKRKGWPSGAPAEGILGFFHVRDFDSSIDPAVQFVVAEDLVFGDRAVDDVIDRSTGERENTLQRPSDDDVLGVRSFGMRNRETPGTEDRELAHGGRLYTAIS